MHSHRTRRQLLVGAATALSAACAASRVPPPSPATAEHPRSLAEVESRVGGRLGVFALDTASGRVLAHRPDERFAMCSTFKWALAAAVLARVDRGQLALDAPVAYSASDLLEYAPVTRSQLPAGSMSVEALARADGPAITPALAQCALHDPFAAVRLAAVRALVQRSPREPEARAALDTVRAADADRSVRDAAVVAREGHAP